MVESVHVILIVSFAALILVLVLILTFRRCFRPKKRSENAFSDTERASNLQNGIARLHQVSPHHHHDAANKPNNYKVVRKGVSSEPLIFTWADHPSLVTDAVENGWPRFAFTTFTSSPSVKSARSILGSCGGGVAAGDCGGEINNVEISWEVCEGSSDYMQKIRLNPGLRKMINGVNSTSTAAVSVIRTALPLPGPQLGAALSFPQEAYFEITILGGDGDDEKSCLDGERIKLIDEDFNAKNSSGSSSLIDVRSSLSERRKKGENGGKQGGRNEGVLLSVGLTGGGALPLKIPGGFPASVGFNSTGSVYLNGIKLVSESGKEEWGRAGKVIGCGYNPGQKKVIFTVDSQLVHEIHCKTDEFGSPLYPTIAANTDIEVLINLGQRSFSYAPANLQRTPNPCFFITNGNSPVLGYDDSKELFSMGRIDSQWLQRNATRSNNNTVNSIRSLEFDQESEGDLFEIVLDRSITGRSPYSTTTYQS